MSPEKSATNQFCPWRLFLGSKFVKMWESLMFRSLHRAKRNQLLWTPKSCTYFSISALEYNIEQKAGEKQPLLPFYAISASLFPITENCLSVKGMKIMAGGKKHFWQNFNYKAQRTTTCSHNPEIKTILIYNSNSCSFQYEVLQHSRKNSLLLDTSISSGVKLIWKTS